jgi:hypothetical protein
MWARNAGGTDALTPARDPHSQSPPGPPVASTRPGDLLPIRIAKSTNIGNFGLAEKLRLQYNQLVGTVLAEFRNGAELTEHNAGLAHHKGGQ